MRLGLILIKKDQLNTEKEIFIGVNWKKPVPDENQGYCEKGLISIPLVAYMLNDRTKHQKLQNVLPTNLRDGLTLDPVTAAEQFHAPWEPISFPAGEPLSFPARLTKLPIPVIIKLT